jgi:hypothetical protein
MSQFGEPGPGHRNALDAVAEARQTALSAASKMRQAGPPPHHPNLAPASDEEPRLATIATQAVVDYLMQLRPYRNHSSTWNVSFGELQLPETMPGEKNPAESWNNKGRGPDLYICQNPTFYVQNVSDFVDVANMTVQYSSQTRTPRGRGDWEPEPNPGSITKAVEISTEEYGTLRFTDKERARELLFGDLSPTAALEYAELADEDDTTDTEEDSVTLGDPNATAAPGDTRGRDPQVESYKLVFPPGELLRFVQLGDDVAAELDVLADLEAPDHAAGPGGAV